MPRHAVRRITHLLPIAALALVLAPAAVAQQPPSPQPPTAANADLAVTLSGDGGGSELEEGERYVFEARVVNHGPGTARAVKLVVSTPEDFDLDDVSHEAECATDPGGEGRMVCSYGDLPPGAEVRLKFRGQFRDDERYRTHVFVESTSPDPDPSNDHDRQGVKVHENEGDPGGRGGAGVACPGLTLSGGPNGDEDVLIDDDLELRLNGRTFFEDADGGPDEFAPIEISGARNGDELRVIIINNGMRGPLGFFGELFLTCDDGRSRRLANATVDPLAGDGPFFDVTFTIDF